VNYFVITHETGIGLVSTQGRGRPSNNQQHQNIFFPQELENEVLSLRRTTMIDDTEKIILLISVSSSEMVQLVAMYPEVWFMDVTSGTNRQKSDMFMLAIRTPHGITYPGNFTFLPSGKRWVFECIYRYAFIALFGSETCSRNRLALFDEDNAEYGPFENCIRTMPEYKNSHVMLCAFHAVWMPFKKNIFPLITKQFSNSKGLTKTGKSLGMYNDQFFCHTLFPCILIVVPFFVTFSSGIFKEYVHVSMQFFHYKRTI